MPEDLIQNKFAPYKYHIPFDFVASGMHPYQNDAISSKIRIPLNMVWLGGLGVIPFAASSAVAVLASPQLSVHGEFALLVYGAVILSFLGGILWGRILAFASVQAVSNETRSLFVSIVPSLTGWIAVLIGPGFGLPALAIAFLLMLGTDLIYAKCSVVPAWYPKLRVPLTLTVIPLLFAPAVFG